MNKLKIFCDLIRLKQISGATLLVLPCYYAMALIIKNNPDLNIYNLIKTLFLFTIGAFLMRSAGCIINDLQDIKFDKNVARTKSRPLASNSISTNHALIILAILLFLSFLILIQFNQNTIIAGFIAVLFVATYPMMKRITYFPQLFLGITFNFGVIMASLALKNSIDFGVIILYLATIMWTLLYDTIYGFQDIEDDLRIGVKSTAIKFSQHNYPKKILYKITAIIFLLFTIIGVAEEFNIYFFLTIFLNFILMFFAIKKCNLNKPKDCLKFFKLNNFFGVLMLLAIAIG